jgi:hypothetical protein
MISREEEDNSYQNIKDKQGTTIISVVPRHSAEMGSPPSKRGKKKGQSRRDRLPKISNAYKAYPESDIANQ